MEGSTSSSLVWTKVDTVSFAILLLQQNALKTVPQGSKGLFWLRVLKVKSSSWRRKHSKARRRVRPVDRSQSLIGHVTAIVRKRRGNRKWVCMIKPHVPPFGDLLSPAKPLWKVLQFPKQAWLAGGHMLTRACVGHFSSKPPQISSDLAALFLQLWEHPVSC